MNPKPMNKKKTPEVPNMELPERSSNTPQELTSLNRSVRAGRPQSEPQETGIRAGSPEQAPVSQERMKKQYTWFEKYMKGDAGVDKEGMTKKSWFTLGTVGNLLGLKFVKGIGASIGETAASALGASEETSQTVGNVTGEALRIAAYAALTWGAWELIKGYMGVASTRAGAAVDAAMEVQEAGKVLAQPETFTYPGLSPASGGVGAPITSGPAPLATPDVGPTIGIPD